MAIKRLYDTLVGATVVWNQLVPDSTASATIDGVTVTNNGDGSWTINGTKGDTATRYAFITAEYDATHVYYFTGFSGGSASYGYFVGTYSGSLRRPYLYDTSIFKFESSINQFSIRLMPGVTYDNLTVTPQLIDLTALFGSASIADYLYNLEQTTAGAGVAKLREWGFLTDEYIPYDEGSLESVEATAHKMVGFNQLNITNKITATYNAAVGSTLSTATPSAQVTGENPLQINIVNGWSGVGFVSEKLIPNQPYTINYTVVAPTDSGIRRTIYIVDDDYTVISSLGVGTIGGTFRYTVTPLAYNRRIVVYFSSNTVQPLTVSDLCINLSNPDRNGEYEPYSAHTYDLGADTLRGLFKLDSNNNLYADGDTKTSDGTVTRKYAYALLNDPDKWTNYSGNVATYRYTDRYTDRKFGSRAIGICSCFDKYSSTSPLCISWLNSNDSSYVGIIDNNNVLSLDALKTMASAGQIAIVYELATHTTEQSTPFASPQICDPDGTEEYVTSNGVPVGHETRYQL